MQIEVKYVGEVDKLEFIDGSKSDWIDLRCAVDIELKAGEYKAIPLGVCIKVPSGYESIVAPRSSTFKHYGILAANSIGVIDESYCGDDDQWHFLAFATRDCFVPKNTRICQFRIIQHQPSLKIVEVSEMGVASRGGIGSTGKV